MKLELDVRLRQGGFALEVRETLAGRVTGVYGPSGAGKTTLLHLLAGLVRGVTGSIVLDGQVLQDSAAGRFVPPHRRRIGLAFQDCRLFPHLSVEGNLRFGLRRVPPDRRRLGLDEVAGLLQIRSLLPRRIEGLSGGERQRVALARALLCSPRLLLLDEPLHGLDPGLRHQVLPFLRRVRDACDIPILMVSHHLEEILELTDRMLVLDGGRVLGHDRFPALVRDTRILPLMHDLGLLSLLRLRVLRRAAGEGTAVCAVCGGAPDAEIRIPATDAQPGREVRAVLPAADVALAREPLAGLSSANQLAGRIREVAATPQRCYVLVDLGRDAGADAGAQDEPGPRLLAAVDPAALARLGLGSGDRVRCIFGTHDVRVLR